MRPLPRRQRIHRTVDVLLLCAFTLSFVAFLLAALVIHRLEVMTHIANVHVHLHQRRRSDAHSFEHHDQPAGGCDLRSGGLDAAVGAGRDRYTYSRHCDGLRSSACVAGDARPLSKHAA